MLVCQGVFEARVGHRGRVIQLVSKTNLLVISSFIKTEETSDVGFHITVVLTA